MRWAVTRNPACMKPAFGVENAAARYSVRYRTKDVGDANHELAAQSRRNHIRVGCCDCILRHGRHTLVREAESEPPDRDHRAEVFRGLSEMGRSVGRRAD